MRRPEAESYPEDSAREDPGWSIHDKNDRNGNDLDEDIAPPLGNRFTLDGDGTVEARIARDQAMVARAVTALLQPSVFRGLVLMGGYGRGEGGYFWRAGNPEPFNDYDYFVVVRGLSRTARNAVSRDLGTAAKSLKVEVGVEVDFALLREERLPLVEYSLMNAEMLWGHRVVAGDPDVLAAMPAMPFANLPLGEFTRLLLNRGSLLLINQQRLAVDEALDAGAREVFFKYLFKAVLACGDVRLAGNHRYHPSYVAKAERLAALDWLGKTDFHRLYQQAWEQKFHPNYSQIHQEDLLAWQGRVVGLWLETLRWFEQVRTGLIIPDWTAYGAPQFPKGQGGCGWGVLRNAAITLRDFGLAELLRHPRWSQRYPRERLIAALPLLLTSPSIPVAPVVADALALPYGLTWTDAVRAFLALWRRFA